MSGILLFINHRSRRGAEKLDGVLRSIKERGIQILNDPNFACEEDPLPVLRKWHDKAQFVVVGGGDGTINRFIDPLIETGIPLHVIPLGTANNFAKSLDIPSDIDANLDLMLNGKINKVDVGYVNEIPFVSVAGVGLSTIVNRSVTRKAKQLLGPLAFVYTALRTIPKLKPFKIEILMADAVYKARSWQLTVCNGRYYGSGFTIEKNASLLDGVLDCVSCEMRKWWHGFLLVPPLFFGYPANKKTVTHFKSTAFTIRTKYRKKMDVDGEIRTYTPAEFKIRPQALKVVVPSNL